MKANYIICKRKSWISINKKSQFNIDIELKFQITCQVLTNLKWIKLVDETYDYYRRSMGRTGRTWRSRHCMVGAGGGGGGTHLGYIDG